MLSSYFCNSKFAMIISFPSIQSYDAVFYHIQPLIAQLCFLPAQKFSMISLKTPCVFHHCISCQKNACEGHEREPLVAGADEISHRKRGESGRIGCWYKSATGARPDPCLSALGRLQMTADNPLFICQTASTY